MGVVKKGVSLKTMNKRSKHCRAKVRTRPLLLKPERPCNRYIGTAGASISTNIMAPYNSPNTDAFIYLKYT